jgi:hypothetical protein
MIISIAANLVIMLIELTITHPTEDAARTVQMILKGRYSKMFWRGVVLFSNMLPLALLLLGSGTLTLAASVIVIIGIYLIEKIWIEAPQRIPLT